MERQARYPQEMRERAVRMVFEHQDEYGSQWAAITSVATKWGHDAGYAQEVGAQTRLTRHHPGVGPHDNQTGHFLSPAD